MKRIAVLGAGLGGTIMAYELRDRLGKEVEIHLLSKGATYSFVPSNPWVAVGWREREEIEVDLRAPLHFSVRRRPPPSLCLVAGTAVPTF